MLRPRVFSIRAISEAGLLCLVLVLGSLPMMAQSKASNYALILASGFLCDPGDSSACPATAKANQGDSYELSGAGTFDAQSKSVKAAGTFTHKSPNGSLIEMGVWVASELVSFDSYGLAPGALMRLGQGFGPPRFGPMRMGMFSGPMAAGGRAVLRIRLLPMSGFAKNATLQVNCALGKVPDEHQVEGIRLAFEGGGAEFDQELGGRALFLLTRPRASAAAKAPTPEVGTNPAPTEVQQ